MASSSSFSNPGSAVGTNWTKMLYFDPEADKHQKAEHIFYVAELKRKMDSLTPSNTLKEISRVQVYTAAHKKSKHRFSFRKDGTEHIFLVVTVGQDSRFSLEITDGGITIQRSQSIDGVTKFCRSKTRKIVSVPTHDIMIASVATFGDLLEWLQSRSTEWGKSNCHDFASEVFTYVTKTALKIAKPDNVCGDQLIPEENGQYYAYYNPEAVPDKVGSKYQITEHQLKHRLKEYVNSREKIKTVYAFKTPLSESQWTFSKLHHLFIVLQTDSWWWSIEKNDEGLTIQRSKILEAVKDNYRQAPRLKKDRWFWNWEVTEVLSGEGEKTIKELITWLEDKQWLYRTYHLTDSNCQHFGKAVFDYVSKKSILKIAT